MTNKQISHENNKSVKTDEGMKKTGEKSAKFGEKLRKKHYLPSLCYSDGAKMNGPNPAKSQIQKSQFSKMTKIPFNSLKNPL